MRPFILSDNQELTREGVASLVRKEFPGAGIVVAPARKILLEELRRHPDAVVVLDYALFDFDSEQQMFNTLAGVPSSSWLLLLDEPGEPFLRRVLVSAPSVGLADKNDSLKELGRALACAWGGRTYVCDMAADILKKGVPQAEAAHSLTAAEMSVLHGIALGKTTKEIAWEKSLSFHTVNTHRRNVFRKLGVNNLHEAVRYAFKLGIIDMTEYYI